MLGPFTVTLGVTAREVDFPNISDRDINYSLCAFPNVPSGLKVMVFVVHELNTVQHEFLHLWKKILAC